MTGEINSIGAWYRASDGWTFYLQPSGMLTDTVDPDRADLAFNSVEDLYYWDEDTQEVNLRLEAREHAAKFREELEGLDCIDLEEWVHRYVCERGKYPVLWPITNEQYYVSLAQLSMMDW